MEGNTDRDLNISVPCYTSSVTRAKAKQIRKLNWRVRQALWDLGRCFDIEEQCGALSPVQKILFEEYGTKKLLELLDLYNRYVSHSIQYGLREKVPEEKEKEEKEEPDNNRLHEIGSSPVWSLAYIIDETSFEMMDLKVPFCMLTGLTSEARKQDPRNLGRGVSRRFYEEQARFKMYRIPIFHPPPVFVVYLKHLDDRLKRELSGLDWETKDFVMREAISRVFEQIDKRFYLQSVKPLLRWRME